MSISLTEERRRELRLMIAAVKDHLNGCAPESCGGSGLDPCPLFNAIETLAQPHGTSTRLLADLDQELCGYGEVPAAADEPAWHLRTWADVVQGDAVRVPGTEQVTTVLARYRHPSEDPCGRGWHVVPMDASLSKWAHTKDHVVQPGECAVVLAAHPDGPMFMPPGAPVEIEMYPSELLAVELAGGWPDRMELRR